MVAYIFSMIVVCSCKKRREKLEIRKESIVLFAEGITVCRLCLLSPLDFFPSKLIFMAL